MNLPKKITFANNNTIEYLYDANGTKLKKVVTESANITETQYLDGFQYVNDTLSFFQHAEGYVKYTAAGRSSFFNYVYNYTDHLGNIRLRYTIDPATDQIAILEEDHYYPFGLKHQGYNNDNYVFMLKGDNVVELVPGTQYLQDTYKYKYNGKELQTELGLNVYDFGNRNYQADLGRFFNQDRFAEKYYHLNPYQYGANNPVIYNDIKGDSILIHSKQDKDRILYDNGNLYSKNRETGKWEAYQGKNLKVDKNGNTKIKGFLGKATAALDKIRTGGDAGAELVRDLQDASKFITITEGNNSSTGKAGGVSWSPSSTTGGPNQDGNSRRPSFVGLAHELGHAHDGLDGVVNDTEIGKIGNKIIPFAEYTAMHWENRIRGEHGISLRTHYGVGNNGQIIGQALNSSGQGIFSQNQTMPTVNFQVNYSSSGIQIVPVSGTTTIVVPYQYKK